MKTIVNVYKHKGLWLKPPPGIGDYLRGCCYLEEKSCSLPPSQRFAVRFNLDLSPASEHLDYSNVRFPASPQILASAEEYFQQERDGDVDPVVDEFLVSKRETLFVSTNRSWRGTDDLPSQSSLDHVRQILNVTSKFEVAMLNRLAGIPRPFVVVAIRDDNEEAARSRWLRRDTRPYLTRVESFIETIVDRKLPPGCAVVCISNNVRLRGYLCRRYGYTNFKSSVGNTGSVGAFSEAELQDAALIKAAKMVFSLSYYRWNSGFSLWFSRLNGVPSIFRNAGSDFGRDD